MIRLADVRLRPGGGLRTKMCGKGPLGRAGKDDR